MLLRSTVYTFKKAPACTTHTDATIATIMKRGIKTIIGVDNRFNDIKMRGCIAAGNYVSINGGFVWVKSNPGVIILSQNRLPFRV